MSEDPVVYYGQQVGETAATVEARWQSRIAALIEHFKGLDLVEGDFARAAGRLQLALMRSMPPCRDWDLFCAIVEQESGGRWGAHAHGEEAWGPAQIRQPVLDDVSDFFGVHLTLKECRNPFVAFLAFRTWLQRWSDAYFKQMKARPTTEQLARMWNGGPTAAFEDSEQHEATTGY